MLMLATQKIQPSQRCPKCGKYVINGLKSPTDIMFVVIVNLKENVIKALL
jgi:uncharacterized Zn finger protein